MNIDFKAGVVRIIDANGRTVGTGFVVTSDGLIATCAHVVDNARSDDFIHLIFYDPNSAKEKSEVRVARVEPAYWLDAAAKDVAILRLEGPLSKEAVPLPLGSSLVALSISCDKMTSTYTVGPNKPERRFVAFCF